MTTESFDDLRAVLYFIKYNTKRKGTLKHINYLIEQYYFFQHFELDKGFRFQTISQCYDVIITPTELLLYHILRNNLTEEKICSIALPKFTTIADFIPKEILVQLDEAIELCDWQITEIYKEFSVWDGEDIPLFSVKYDQTALAIILYYRRNIFYVIYLKQ